MERSFTVATDAVCVRLQQHGNNPGTIFIHGFSGDLSVWDGLWSLLPIDFSTLRYDLRGFGQTVALSDNSFSHTDDLLTILDTLEIERCNLVGVSMGGAIAVNFALNFSHRVARVVLISPGLVAWEWSEPWKRRWRQITAHARNGEMEEAKELWWMHPLFETTRKKPVANTLYESIRRYSGREWIVDRQRAELPDVDRLYQLSTPTLLLSGGRDLEDFRLIADLLEASVPTITRINFPDNGHMLYLEEPDKTVSVILEFLQHA